MHAHMLLLGSCQVAIYIFMLFLQMQGITEKQKNEKLRTLCRVHTHGKGATRRLPVVLAACNVDHPRRTATSITHGNVHQPFAVRVLGAAHGTTERTAEAGRRTATPTARQRVQGARQRARARQSSMAHGKGTAARQWAFAVQMGLGTRQRRRCRARRCRAAFAVPGSSHFWPLPSESLARQCPVHEEQANRRYFIRLASGAAFRNPRRRASQVVHVEQHE